MLALLLWGCSSGSRDDVIIAQVGQAIQTSGSELELPRYVRGEWDRMCVAQPHISEAQLDSLLGLHWDEFDRDMVASETHRLLLFMQNGRVVEEVMFPVAQGLFAGNVCVSRAAARFRIVQDTAQRGLRKLFPVSAPTPAPQ